MKVRMGRSWGRGGRGGALVLVWTGGERVSSALVGESVPDSHSARSITSRLKTPCDFSILAPKPKTNDRLVAPEPLAMGVGHSDGFLYLKPDLPRRLPHPTPHRLRFVRGIGKVALHEQALCSMKVVMNPSMLIRRFAASLGWHGIERTDIVLTPETAGGLPAGTVVTCWSTTDLKFFIQINQKTPREFGRYNVSVVAERYNIGPMDFVTCEFDNVEEAQREAERLFPLFARKNFRDPCWQRAYLEEHPERLLRPEKNWRGWKGRLRGKV